MSRNGWSYSDGIAYEFNVAAGKGMGARLIPLRTKGMIESKRERPGTPLLWRPAQ